MSSPPPRSPGTPPGRSSLAGAALALLGENFFLRALMCPYVSLRALTFAAVDGYFNIRSSGHHRPLLPLEGVSPVDHLGEVSSWKEEGGDLLVGGEELPGHLHLVSLQGVVPAAAPAAQGGRGGVLVTHPPLTVPWGGGYRYRCTCQV